MSARKVDTHRRGQRGMTLIELSVTVLILGLVLGTATTAFLSATRVSTGADSRIENLGQAQLLMRTATKDLRTATPLDNGNVPAFTLATPWRVQFYAYLNTNSGSATGTAIPKRVLLYVDTVTDPKNPRLVEKVWDPVTATWTPTNPTYVPDTSAKIRFVGNYITNTPSSAQPVFEFFNNASPPALITPNSTGPYGAELGADQLDEVHAVRIRLRVRKDARPDVEGTLIENRVRLPNVIYNPVSSTS